MKDEDNNKIKVDNNEIRVKEERNEEGMEGGKKEGMEGGKKEGMERGKKENVGSMGSPVKLIRTVDAIHGNISLNKRKLGGLNGMSDNEQVTACYICHIPDVPGKFNAKKAMELGLRPGPVYKELQKGISVLSDDSMRRIHPHDVIEKSTPGAIFIILDVPSIDHFNVMCNHKTWELYTKGGEFAQQVTYIMHLTPVNVLQSNEYRQWMNNMFGRNQKVNTSYHFIRC